MQLNDTWARLDQTFLQKLDTYPNKKKYAKIISLNWDEEPIAEISGNVVSGSINVDGSSIVRRTCNLTITTNKVRIDDISWSLRTKFYVYIGLENTIDSQYEDIIWFPQGMFILTSLSSTLNNQGYTVTLQGKDKMCLINGDVGGALFAAHDFAKVEVKNKDGILTYETFPIYNIIREAVHVYAQEPYHNIVINDLDTCGVELLDYRSTDAKLYIFDQQTNDDTVQLVAGGTHWEYDDNGRGRKVSGTPSFNGAASTQIRFESRNDRLCQVFDVACDTDQNVSYNLTPFLYHNTWYTLYKRINPRTDVNTVAGYRATEITYNGDLTISIGGTITQMLDKIVKMLGEFEYFYDLNGRFIFQRKRIYFNSAWTNAVVDENKTYYDTTKNREGITYDFLNGHLIESFQNKPNLSAIRNDFSIWGTLKGVDKKALPIHLRYAIDHKPSFYYSLLEKKVYCSTEVLGGQYDWRELIYRMALDNLAARTNIEGLVAALATQNKFFEVEQQYEANPTENEAIYNSWKKSVMYHYDNTELGQADYQECYTYSLQEKTFIPMESPDELAEALTNNEFIYGPNSEYIRTQLTMSQYEQLNDELGYNYALAQTYVNTPNDPYIHMRNTQKENELLDEIRWENILDKTHNELDAWQDTFNTGYDAYFADMLGFWPLLYRTQQTAIVQYKEDGTINADATGIQQYVKSVITNDDFTAWEQNGHWNPLYITWDGKNAHFKEPEALFFWIDFFDIIGDETEFLYQYSVDVIGRRAIAVNDTDVKAIYFRDTPNLLFVSPDYTPVEYEENLAYARINIVPPYSDYFQISSQGKSAKERLDTMLYEGTYFQDQITISAIPIYYLEPNTRIAVYDEQSGINGEYLIKSYSIQLAHDGMMSITATKAVERII